MGHTYKPVAKRTGTPGHYTVESPIGTFVVEKGDTEWYGGRNHTEWGVLEPDGVYQLSKRPAPGGETLREAVASIAEFVPAYIAHHLPNWGTLEALNAWHQRKATGEAAAARARALMAALESFAQIALAAAQGPNAELAGVALVQLATLNDALSACLPLLGQYATRRVRFVVDFDCNEHPEGA